MLLLTSASSSELHQPPSLYAVHSPSRSPEALQPSRRPSSLSSLSADSHTCLPPDLCQPSSLVSGSHTRLSAGPLWPSTLNAGSHTRLLIMETQTEKPIKPSCREIFQVMLFLRIDWSVGGDFMPSLLV